jgi:hypothetical protein
MAAPTKAQKAQSEMAKLMNAKVTKPKQAPTKGKK